MGSGGGPRRREALIISQRCLLWGSAAAPAEFWKLTCFIPQFGARWPTALSFARLFELLT